MDEPFGLARFVDAQDAMMGAVEAELRAGRKSSHWMWFVFPQLRALGRSGMALHFGITGMEEARAYSRHPVLGPRLAHCAGLVLAHAGRASAHAIFGSPDDLKLRSSMTLFAAADPDEPVFAAVLDAFYGGEADPLTKRLLDAP
ncbi:MAG: DUF1810 domain-containing protein [Pseudomonadota bacterium]